MIFNFWIFFAVGTILVLIIMLKKEHDIIELKDNWFSYIGWPLLIGGIFSLIMYILASRVITTKDNSIYEDNYYLFFYIDNKDQKHGLSPFKSYIDNQSSRKVVIYDVSYASPEYITVTFKRPKPSFVCYPNQEMSTLIDEPDYIFQSPPTSVKTRGKFDKKWVLTYKEDFEDEFYILVY